MKVVVGLGNPGERYAATRHNAGFWVLDRLAAAHGLAFEAHADAHVARGQLPDGSPYALVKPWTFMNRSGGPAAGWFEALGAGDPAVDLLVVYDDLDLPPGQLRLRKKGGHGGHNGLRDVIAAFDARVFPRLRFGIGRPDPGVSVLDHVLTLFPAADLPAIEASVDRASEAVTVFLAEGMDAAMNRFNANPEPAVKGSPGAGAGRASEEEPAIKSATSADDSATMASPIREPSNPEEHSGPDDREATNVYDAGNVHDAGDGTPGMSLAAPGAAQPKLAERIARPFVQFMQLETGSAVLLLVMSGVALAWANSPWAESYEHLLHEPVAFSFGTHALSLSVHHWINDGLMAIFFFLVGMEIKREMVMGDLSTPTRAMMPVLAALGGMVVPAGVYAFLLWGDPAVKGWGIPMATDIAFAVAAMSVLGKRVPPSLKVFLLALAIADDLGAVMVIAVFYTDTIHVGALAWAFGFLAMIFGMNRAGVRAFLPYWVVGAVVWFFMHESGVHATIAGVALGLLTPAHPDPHRQNSLVERGRDALDHLREWVTRDHEDHGGHKRHHAVLTLQDASRDSLSPLDYLTNRLERPVLFVVMPLFALANAGVALETETLGNPVSRQVAVAVIAGLVLGKPIGITVFSWIAVRLKLAEMPRGVNFAAIFATGMLAGIGFTVALFIAALSFDDAAITAGAKVGILIGSVLACVIGLAVLARALPAEPQS